MRKQIIDPASENLSSMDGEWLDLRHQAQVELTSEDMAYPIEEALVAIGKSGWRASQAGKQMIRIIFNEPQYIRRIQLLFKEDQQVRTQEFVLRYSSDGRQSYHEIVRQQYNFSPSGAIRELEDYKVNLAGVTAIELVIIPDINKEGIKASLAHLRVA